MAISVPPHLPAASGSDRRRVPPVPAGFRGERRSPMRPRFREGWRKHISGSTQGDPPRPDAEGASPVCVWMSRVDTLLAAASNLNLLNEDDRAAMRTLRCQSARESATAARILLRLSLSAMTGRRIAPQDWQFARNNFGKPFVKDTGEGIDFSVSHVDAVVMIATGRDVSVGIDVETVDQQLEDKVVDHFCHTSERQVIEALPAAQRRRVFLEFWTEKEAYTKMLGVGHSLEFQSLSVLRSQEVVADGSRVCIEDFYFSVDHSLYHAALAVDRKAHHRPIDIQLINVVLPGRGAFTMSPADF
jgi:phosphopantetheinyl transferase